MLSKKLVSPKRNSISSTQSSEQFKDDAIKKKVSMSHSLDDSLINSSSYLNQTTKSTLYYECSGIDDVVITPSHMEFKDGSEGLVMEQILTVKNVGKKAATIKIKEPNSLAFKINADVKTCKLCPGLSISRVVSYSYKTRCSLHTMIPVEINGTKLDYHLICSMSHPRIIAEPTTLNFKRVNLESVSEIKKLKVKNLGGKSARFSIDVGKNNIKINIRPIKGLIKPHSEIIIAVQVIGKCLGTIHGEFWIKSSPNIHILINVHIIKPIIFIDHPTTTNSFTFHNFASTFLETQKYINLTLKNISSNVTNFVVSSEVYNNLICIKEIDVKKNPTFDAYKIHPLEGRLEAFEEIILNITFSPTLKKLESLQKQLRNKYIDYFVAVIKICKVNAEESKDFLVTEPISDIKIEKTYSDYDLSNDESEEDELISHSVQFEEATIYLHGIVEIPQLVFIPDEFNLGHLNIGDKIQRVICIKNPSQNLPLAFSFVYKPWIRCKPRQSRLSPNQSIEVLILIEAQYNLEPKFKLEFNVWAESMENNGILNELKSVNVSKLFVQCTYNPIKARGKTSYNNKICKIESLDKLPQEPNYSLSYKPSENEIKMNHREYWTHYFRSIFSHKMQIDNFPEQDLHIICKSFSTPKINSITLRLWQSFINLKNLEKTENLKKNSSKCLMPLQIYKIHVSPMKLDFGMVGLKSLSCQNITFENKNEFPVTISLINLNPNNIVIVNESENLLQPESMVTYTVEFQGTQYGLFETYINYVVNKKQRYQVAIVAHVVQKKLELKVKEIAFDKDYHPQEGYRIPFKVIEIENKINVDINFMWNMPPDSSFTIEPKNGKVPGKRRLFSVVYHEPMKSNRTIEALLLTEGGARESIKLVAPLFAPKINLIDESLDLGEVPMNIETRGTSVVCNSELYEVYFEIEDSSLLEGVKVSPYRGFIPPRGIVVLNICVKFDCCMDLSTAINIIVQRRFSLQLKLYCTVVFPKLKFKPNKIQIKRLSSNSYQVQEIAVFNLNNSDVTLQFLLKEKYPEFFMSYSPIQSKEFIDDEQIVTILPLSFIKLYLHFLPCEIANYTFLLPMVINQSIGPFDNENCSFVFNKLLRTQCELEKIPGINLLPIPKTFPSIYVDCTVAYPIICFNKLSFEFDDNIRKDELKISNNSEKSICLVLNVESLKNSINCPFTIIWSEGTEPKITNGLINCLLLPDDYINFIIKFEPMLSNFEIFELPINVGNIDDLRMYNKLILKGSRSKELIISDVSEIYFTPLPLKTVTKVKFILQIYRCTKETCICAKICYPEKVSGVFSDNCLAISFPSGVSIKPCIYQEIPVEIEFQSSTPVSFCTKIMFFDIGHLMSLPIVVYGIADNCLLTTYMHKKTINENFLLTEQRQYPSGLVLPSQAIIPHNVEFESKITSLNSSISGASKRESGEGKVRSIIGHKLSTILKKETISEFNANINSFHEKSNRIESLFPFFPLYMDLDNYALGIHKVLRAIDNWLYNSVTKYKFNCNLIEGITAVLSNVIPVKIEKCSIKKNINHPEPCSFIDIFVDVTSVTEIYGIDITDLKENKYENDKTRIDDLLKIYDKILQFLLSKGACVAHISPIYLLNYDDYKNTIADTDFLLPNHAFISRSKQSWLDLILQMYKCYVLNKINDLESHVAVLKNNNEKIDGTIDKRNNSYVSNIIYKSNKLINCQNNEAILLGWLEYHRNIMFGCRSMENFEDHLKDGLAFIAVTITYCPFLKNEFFKDVFKNPKTTVEEMHNAICLVLAWKRIRLGFVIIPSDIIHPIGVQMLMLSVHLFQNLPTYVIRNKIVFNCPLTESITQSIKIPRISNYHVNYVTQFFENEYDSYSTKPITKIHPRKKQLLVTYRAQKILKTTAYLLMCGSTIGPNFAENLVFILEGYPSELKIDAEYTIKSRLYKIFEKNLNINVPYSHETQYELCLSDKRPSTYEDLNIIRWSELQMKKIPKRLSFHEKSITVQENCNTANVKITIACMSPHPRSYWIIFQSKKADFIIQINSIYQTSITDYITINITEDSCICPNYPKEVFPECPFNKELIVPIRNVLLESCLLRMFRKSMSNEEKLFWAEIFENSIGMRLMKWILKDIKEPFNKEIRHIYEPSVLYNVNVDKKNMSITPQNFIIKDNVHQDHDITLTIHIPELDTEMDTELTNAHVTFTSSDKEEIRVCKIDFISNKSISNCSGTSLNTDEKYENNKQKKKKN